MNMGQLMKEAKKMQEEMEKSQENLASQTFDSTTGGGAVYAKVNGNNSVLLTFQKQSTYATATVSNNIAEKFEQLENEYPGLHFTSLMDQGDYIYMIIDSIMSSLLWGALFAIIILFLFLRDIRPTFITLCSIPISVLFAIVLMYFSGVTLNMISLSGLAVSVGMLVDNSIVVLENIDRLIGNILSFLDDTGVLSNTIVIYSSDHGEMLGDFNVFGKSRPEHPSVHIPLCAMGPGILPNRRVSALVELQDLASTFTDYADAGTDFEDSLSLRPILEGKADSCRDYVFSALVPETSVLKHHPDGWYMVFDGKWKLVSDSHGCECLYDMEAAQHEVAAADDDVRKCVMREIIERVVSNRKIPQGFVRG